MSIGPVLTLGLGAFTGGGVRFLPTLGYGTGGTPPPPPAPTTRTSGVRGPHGTHGTQGAKKRPLVVKMRDVVDRESTAEFLKAQLRLRQGITEPAVPHAPTKLRLSKADRARQSALSAEAMRNMETERKNEERQIIEMDNAQIMTLLWLASL